jgi:5-methylcytosine-specific restriction endonuclease McrA
MTSPAYREEIASLSPEDASGRLLELLRKLSLLLDEEPYRVRVKPLYGQTWGNGLFSLGSRASFEGGLDVVTYYVLDTGTRFALSAAPTKSDALEQAREVLEIYGPRLQSEMARHVSAALDARRQRQEAHLAAIRERQAALPQRVKSLPRRRRQIFEESGGKCHYCETVLTLDGKWHIEHKHPRALGGGNEPSNLVASCVPCNMKKRDRTDQEFIAMREKEKAA